jgi:hypothetical protein
VPLDDFACVPVHDLRPFSGACGGSRRPSRFFKERRGHEAPALHANFKHDIRWSALRSLVSVSDPSFRCSRLAHGRTTQ